ncbi:MAG TPA: helix-turn-helix transcriptional regulator [Alphaproteobacteria bacterium]|nr:helix-turn-helix transcriptional regulator [Alphaproteobacteria bacterium]
MADRLAMVRERLGLTQREMADRLGLALGTYGRSEAGRRALDDGEIAEIGSMGINLNWLILAQGDMSAPAQPGAQISGGAAANPALLAQLIGGIADIYRTQNRQLPPDRHGMLVAELYEGLAAITDATEQRGAVRYALSRLAEEQR